MQIATIGIDIGKSSFHVVGLDARGEIVVRRRCSRTQLMRDLANLPPCLVGMEACCGAHHLGRRLVTLGHTVRLIPPQFVKPFVKSQKNDLLDAEAIAEAVQRPTMRFVPQDDGPARSPSPPPGPDAAGSPSHRGDQSTARVLSGAR
jgi:transposase